VAHPADPFANPVTTPPSRRVVPGGDPVRRLDDAGAILATLHARTVEAGVSTEEHEHATRSEKPSSPTRDRSEIVDIRGDPDSSLGLERFVDERQAYGVALHDL
jgi:hypothetical protein